MSTERVAVLVDGKRINTIPVTDRGLQYGDGLWETMAVDKGEILCFKQHMQRLRDGANVLKFDCGSILQRLQQEAIQLARSAERGVIKLILTRGSSARGYRIPQQTKARRIVMLQPWPHWPASWSRRGVKLLLLATRLALADKLAAYKHLNCLQQVIARSEWDNDIYAEGVMRDQRGYVVEGTMSNIFIRCGESWLTPRLDRCGIAGIVRAEIIKYATNTGIKIKCQRVTVQQLCAADEVFICNSVIGLWPVRTLTVSAREYHFAPASFTRSVRRHLRSERIIV